MISSIEQLLGHQDPLALLDSWVTEARNKDYLEPTAMALATASAGGHPTNRMVLLKGVSEEGLLFFTNYRSRKAEQLADNPYAAALFFWPECERQIRAEGRVEKASRDTSAAYFSSRPRRSQLGAWAAGVQSAPLTSLSSLHEALAAREEEFAGGEVPLPPFWGGYLLRPEWVEFWQGRANRLHERVAFQRKGKEWESTLLAP